MPTNALMLTVLPNGLTADGSQLRLTVLVTPVADSGALTDTSPFYDWPNSVGALSWQVTFQPLNAPVLPSAIPLPAVPPAPPFSQSALPEATELLNSSLWRAIFGANRTVTPRKGNSALNLSWRLSHDISTLHENHQAYRLFHAEKRLLSSAMKQAAKALRVAKTPGQLQTAQNDLTSITTAYALSENAITASKPPILYIYPSLGNDNGSYSAQIEARNFALAFIDNAIDSANITEALAIKNRKQYAINLLEHNKLPDKGSKQSHHAVKFAKDSEKLKDVALFAIYLNCIQSVRKPGTSPDTAPIDQSTEDFRLYTLYQTVKSAYQGSDDLEIVGRYIGMHLFHRRLSHTLAPQNPRPDFHQLLGMVNHYPSMMRVLGLAFDLVTKLPPSDGYYLISAAPTENGIGNQLGALTPTSNTTYCRYVAPVPALANVSATPGNFYAVSSDPLLIKERMLNLGAVDPGTNQPLFTLVSEDADGAALKVTDQVNNTNRGGEYASSAPTSMKKKSPYQPGPSDPGVDTPAAVPDPTDAPPSPRTVGIALFARNRLTHLEGVLAHNSAGATATTTPQSFFADDLILGYRVDVSYENKWFSLCDRSSKYDVYDIDHPATIVYKAWKPSTKAEIDADQGYVGFAATQTPVDDNDTQTQVHQTVFTWTGWSLSVPQPKFPIFDQPSTTSVSGSDTQLSIHPMYELVRKDKVLPPLRFDTDYRFRCRVVDIAGNSALLASYDDSLQGVTIQPQTQFSRHEPIRAPQFVLTQPIDRINHPGEHIDRMVARDYDSHSSRILIAPRESLRLAELHGKLTSPRLPSSAFSKFQLMDDGSFPDVQVAIDNGWVNGQDDTQGNRDAIFLPRQEGSPTNPYYPDPLANYIRIDAYLVSDNPNVSRPLGTTQFIPVFTDLPWPERAPVRVRMQPTGRKDIPDPKFDFVPMTDPPGPDFGTASIGELIVTVPDARTVVLSICSVAAISSANRGASDGTVRVHLSNLHDFYKSNTPAELAALGIASGSETSLATALDAISPDYLNPNSFVDGSLDLITPVRTMTLVHAVKRPLDPPDFAPPGSPGDLSVERAFGGSQAAVHGMIEANWLSTGKISCQADWTDYIDDIKQARPAEIRSQETAFTFTSDQTFEFDAGQNLFPPCPRYDDAPYLRVLAPHSVAVPCSNPGLTHVFRDTRAHTVTYSLVAATRFRDYYPGNSKSTSDSDFKIVGRTNRTVTVLSSVRPPALSIAYIIPAFEWTDTYDAKSKTWFSGRNAVLRVYLNRPFCVSGDKEGIGVVLVSKSNPSAPAVQNLVSRWGSDPIHKIVSQISSSELAPENFCQAEDTVHTCMLSEIKKADGTVPADGSNLADIKPYPVHYAEDHENNRRMWFADIPVNTVGSYAPFMRLALVRWQPEALHDSTDDARISQVVFADFMQISVDRWVSIERRDGKSYTITVSGVFTQDQPGCVEPEGNPTFSCSLFSRWYALGKDMGWRPMKFDLTFCYSPAPAGSSISTWTADLRLPHSAFDRKYRILISEREWFPPNPVGRLIYEQFVDLP